MGYRFITSSWGKGYATEAVFKSLRYGVEKFNIQRIVGRAAPADIASVSVLENAE